MRAAVYVEQDQPLIVEEMTPLDPGPGDVVVEIGASGVCHSDLSATNGTLPLPPPTILGHEGAGTVEWVGAEVTRVKKGDRVVATFVPACGACWYCLHGRSNLCEDTGAVMMVPRAKRADGTPVPGFTGLGTFSDTMTIAESQAVKVETDLPDDQLALIGCGVTTGVGAALNTAEIEPGSSVAVIGCGGVGAPRRHGRGRRDAAHGLDGDAAGLRDVLRGEAAARVRIRVGAGAAGLPPLHQPGRARPARPRLHGVTPHQARRGERRLHRHEGGRGDPERDRLTSGLTVAVSPRCRSRRSLRPSDPRAARLPGPPSRPNRACAPRARRRRRC